MNYKTPIAFVSGVLIGGALGYFVTKKLVEDKIEKKLSKEYRELYSIDKLVTKDDVVIASVGRENPVEELVKEAIKKNADKPYIDYGEYSKEDRIERVIEDTKKPMSEILAMGEDEEDYERLQLDPDAEPYLLDEAEFLTATLNDKRTYIWWDGSDTLTNEDNQIVMYTDFNINFPFEFSKTDVFDLYVRDDRVGVDMHITYDARNFYEAYDPDTDDTE